MSELWTLYKSRILLGAFFILLLVVAIVSYVIASRLAAADHAKYVSSLQKEFDETRKKDQALADASIAVTVAALAKEKQARDALGKELEKALEDPVYVSCHVTDDFVRVYNNAIKTDGR